MNVDDQPRRVRQQKRVIVGEIIHFEHDPRLAWLELRNPDFLQKAVIDIEALAHQRRRQFRVVEIEEDPIGMIDALRSELDVLLQVDGHTRIVRRRPVSNAGHTGKTFRLVDADISARCAVPIAAPIIVLIGRFCHFARRLCRLPNLVRGLLIFLRLAHGRSFSLEVGGVLVQFGNGLLSFFRQTIPGIAAQKFFKRRLSFLGIVQVVLVDFSDREQCIEAVLASGIFLAQELILLHGALQDLVVIELPAHLDLQLRHGNHAGIAFGRSWSTEVNAAVGINDALVVSAGTLFSRTAVERFTHALGPGEILASPRISMPDTSVSRQRRKQHHDKRCTQTQPALVSM